MRAMAVLAFTAMFMQQAYAQAADARARLKAPEAPMYAGPDVPARN